MFKYQEQLNKIAEREKAKRVAARKSERSILQQQERLPDEDAYDEGL